MLPEVERMEGVTAPPRDNGALSFAAPWEARTFALAIAVVERCGLPWDEFRSRLMEQITAEPDRPYYESWAAALESLVLGLGLTTEDDITARAAPARLGSQGRGS
jgi:nitrile hydratase accessory protein